MPKGQMLRSMSATEFATWRAFAALEHEALEMLRKDPKMSPQFADEAVWRVPLPGPDEDDEEA